MIVKLEPRDVLTIQFKDTDGEFQVHFDSCEHPRNLIVKETGGLPGNIIGDKNTIMYREDFSQILNRKKVEQEIDDV